MNGIHKRLDKGLRLLDFDLIIDKFQVIMDAKNSNSDWLVWWGGAVMAGEYQQDPKVLWIQRGCL